MRGVAAVRAGVAFVAMEPVAYAAHRWLMHGPGWSWHASHHRRRTTTFERNDRYPAAFASATIGAMAIGTAVPRLRWLRDVGVGVTAYGMAYAFVHDVHVHERVPALRLRTGRTARVLDGLADAHRQHHRSGGEPFGMLVPVVRTARPGGAAPGGAGYQPRSTHSWR